MRMSRGVRRDGGCSGSSAYRQKCQQISDRKEIVWSVIKTFTSWETWQTLLFTCSRSHSAHEMLPQVHFGVFRCLFLEELFNKTSVECVAVPTPDADQRTSCLIPLQMKWIKFRSIPLAQSYSVSKNSCQHKININSTSQHYLWAWSTSEH